MAGEKVRIGIIGLGHRGHCFAEIYHKNPKAELVAIADPSEQRRTEVGRGLGIPEDRRYPGFEILEREDIDMISIHMPDHLHAESFIKAINTGRHIFVESPMADSLSDIRRMLDAWRGTELKVMVGHVLRFNPYFRMLKEMLVEGILGRIFYMEADYIHNLRQKVEPGRSSLGLDMEWSPQTGISIVRYGVYPFDLIRWYAGSRPTEVQVFSNHIAFPEMEHDDCTVAIFRFENGCIAKIAVCLGAIAPFARYNNMTIYGTKGSIIRDKLCLKGFGAKEVALPDVYEQGYPYDLEVDHFLDCILQDRRPLVDALDGANSAAAIIMVEEAVRLRKSVNIPWFE
ncbi:MAG TPA: Gfo/Idh/MocA family oxidoreductase [Candidatus Latescibacteria bacterium]|nr:Gfo/Idh/MocA family oxidoreductase [Candidatus Latescibacterota bacterium]